MILWHPDSPGVRLYVRKLSVWRRLGLVRSEFATLSEACSKHTSYMPWFTDWKPPGALDRTRPSM